jgi:hypothetical protein
MTTKRKNERKSCAEPSGRTGRRPKRCSTKRLALTTTSGMCLKALKVSILMKNLLSPRITQLSRRWNRISKREASVVGETRSKLLSSKTEVTI